MKHLPATLLSLFSAFFACLFIITIGHATDITDEYNDTELRQREIAYFQEDTPIDVQEPLTDSDSAEQNAHLPCIEKMNKDRILFEK